MFDVYINLILQCGAEIWCNTKHTEKYKTIVFDLQYLMQQPLDIQQDRVWGSVLIILLTENGSNIIVLMEPWLK